MNGLRTPCSASCEPSAWATPLQARPKWWGKLVTELIYDTMDEDVTEYLKENKPSPGVRWHRQLVSRCYEVIGMAKDSDSIRELREKVARHYGKRQGQFTLFLKPPKD